MTREPAAARALLVERQPALVPFFRDTLERAGHADVIASRSTSATTLRRVRPDTVLIGPGSADVRPLAAIRRIRQERPSTRIVVVAYRADPVWRSVALAVGADAVLGPDDDRSTLDAALASGASGRVRNLGMRRTS